MRKRIHYCNTKFTQKVIQEGFKVFSKALEAEKISGSYKVEIGNVTWEHDNDHEFFADYSKDIRIGYYSKSVDYSQHTLTVSFQEGCTSVTVTDPERGKIEEIQQVFAINADSCKLPAVKNKHKDTPTIFIGHGRSSQWRDLKDHLQDKHDYKIQAYEVGARAGHTIRDILEEMLKKSSFALLVMTGEDLGADEVLRARENVIHEIGLFQGHLGFSKAIVLFENGTNEFSNLHGIQQIRFTKNNIKETFGEVLATLKRELSY